MYSYSDEWKKFKPPDDVLRQCHQVLITDNDAEADNVDNCCCCFKTSRVGRGRDLNAVV